MDFEKMIENLTPPALKQLRDRCNLKVNMRAQEHEIAIRNAIKTAFDKGYAIIFSDPYDDDLEHQIYINNSDYHVEIE